MTVTVALPVLDGGPLLGEVLAAVRAQEGVADDVELLVIDSGSTDGSRELARRHGARVAEIPRAQFSHGGTRNRLMELAAGTHVAFLTQDSVPAGPRWLAALLARLRARRGRRARLRPVPAREAGDSPMVRRELRGVLRELRRRSRRPRRARARAPISFYSSANGAVARWAWERVPFPDGAVRRGPGARARRPRRRDGEGVPARGRRACTPTTCRRCARCAGTSTTSAVCARCMAIVSRSTRGAWPDRSAARSPPIARSCVATGSSVRTHAVAAASRRQDARPKPRRERRPPARVAPPRPLTRRAADVRRRRWR